MPPDDCVFCYITFSSGGNYFFLFAIGKFSFLLHTFIYTMNLVLFLISFILLIIFFKNKFFVFKRIKTKYLIGVENYNDLKNMIYSEGINIK